MIEGPVNKAAGSNLEVRWVGVSGTDSRVMRRNWQF